MRIDAITNGHVKGFPAGLESAADVRFFVFIIYVVDDIRLLVFQRTSFSVSSFRFIFRFALDCSICLWVAS